MSHIGLADLLGVRTKAIDWERPLVFFGALFCSGLVSLVVYPLFGSGFSNTESFFRNWEYWEPRAILTAALWPLFLLGALSLAVRWAKPLLPGIFVGALVGNLAQMVASAIIYNYPNLGLRTFTMQIGVLPSRLLHATIFALVLWGGLRLTAGKDLTAERKERRLTKGFYLVAALTLIGASLMMLATVIISTTFEGPWPRSYMDQAFVSRLFAGLIGLFGEIVFLILTYKMWKAIQDGHARTAPGAAVGLLFVPFFNLYWIFQAYRGFAKDFNSFVSRHSIKTPLLPVSLFTAYGALMICSVIPFIGWPLIVVNFFVMLVMISKICDAVNSIPEKLPDQEASAPASYVL